MRTLVKATLILGSSSAVSLLAGLLTNKLYALWLGPEGIGILGVLQGLVVLCSVVAGFGVSVGIVRVGAGFQEQSSKLAALYKIAWATLYISSTVLALLFMLFQPLSLISATHPWQLWSVYAAVCATMAHGLQLAWLNLHAQIRKSSASIIWGTLLGTVLSVAAVKTWGSPALFVAVFLTAGSLWMCSRFFMHSLRPAKLADKAELRPIRRELWGFGLFYAASSLLGSAAVQILPLLVLHELGQREAGFYRAAFMLSASYMGLLASTLSQEYYPRMAKNTQPSSDINQQIQFLLLFMGLPLMSLLVLAPWVIPLLFTTDFVPAIKLFEWLVLADIIRITSWAMALAILAHSPPKIYLLTETVGGVGVLGFAWIALQPGFSAVGPGFLVAYVVYGLFVAGVLYQQFQFRLTNANKITLLGLVLAALVIQLSGFLWVKLFIMGLAIAGAFTYSLKQKS
jgi:O-antigen/teichoic acid export membrane protein